MTQEDKELLLKDISARLPYGVEADCVGEYVKIKYIDTHRGTAYISNLGKTKWESIEVITPYLRPMSSMTEEEKKKYKKFCIAKFIKAGPGYTYDGWWEYYDTIASFDYLNSIHVDYRGLIEKNLAIKVTKENNPYKNILI